MKIVDMPTRFQLIPDDICNHIYKIYYCNVINELNIINKLKNKRKYLKKQNKKNKLFTNESVIIYWLNNVGHNSQKKDHKNDKYTFNTDGKNLYSNDLLIGFTRNDKKIIYDYTASNNKFISYTCSRHINMAKKYCDIII
jgi:hypothetical protein